MAMKCAGGMSTNPPKLSTRRTRGDAEAGGDVLLDEPEEWLHVAPDPREARGQLMVVVEQRQRHVRPRSREFLHRAVVDRGVAKPLEDERRLHQRRIEGIVLQAVLVERHVERTLFAVRVVKERQRAAAAPLLDPFGRQQMMTRL